MSKGKVTGWMKGILSSKISCCCHSQDNEDEARVEKDNTRTIFPLETPSTCFIYQKQNNRSGEHVEFFLILKRIYCLYRKKNGSSL